MNVKFLFLSLLTLACSKSPSASGETSSSEAVDPPAPAHTERTEAGPASSPIQIGGSMVPAGTDPKELYAECEARVEQPEAPGECSSNDDCVKAGCSAERCISKASAEGMMGTCEMLPCFEVLDTCACDAGQCRWTLKPG